MAKFCSNCGASIEEGVSFCPQCGNNLKVAETGPPRTPPIGTTENVTRERSRGAVEHLTIGYNVAMSNPMVFVPALLSGVIGIIISYITGTLYSFGLLSLILGLISTAISFILGFASLDMSRDAYSKQALDLGSSTSYVFQRLTVFLIAAIFGALLSITIVFIPAVILTFVIMVIDETGIMDAFGKAFKVLFSDLGDIIIVLIIAIIGSFVFGYIPFFSTFLNSALNVVISLAFIDIYVNYKNQ
jgi:hypothetical protein